MTIHYQKTIFYVYKILCFSLRDVILLGEFLLKIYLLFYSLEQLTVTRNSCAHLNKFKISIKKFNLILFYSIIKGGIFYEKKLQ